MFELLVLCWMSALLIFTIAFAFKFMFFILGLLFGGIGLILKLVFMLIGGILIFPVALLVLGALFSGGGLILVLVIAGLVSLVGERKRPAC